MQSGIQILFCILFQVSVVNYSYQKLTKEYEYSCFQKLHTFNPLIASKHTRGGIIFTTRSPDQILFAENEFLKIKK